MYENCFIADERDASCIMQDLPNTDEVVDADVDVLAGYYSSEQFPATYTYILKGILS